MLQSKYVVKEYWGYKTPKKQLEEYRTLNKEYVKNKEYRKTAATKKSATKGSFNPRT